MEADRSAQSGFTLLELVVALTIFAFIAIGAHAMLHAVLTAQGTAHQHEAGLGDLQKTMRLLEQDGRQLEPASVTFNDGAYALRFTRHGWSNPLDLPRSDRLAVAYGVRGATLIRFVWRPGDGEDAAPEEQELLKGVSDFRARLEAPDLLDVTFTQSDFGRLRREIMVTEP